MKDHYGNETFALQPISKIDIPAKIIKNFAKNKDIFNKCLQESKLSDLMIKAEITPVFKKLINTLE